MLDEDVAEAGDVLRSADQVGERVPPTLTSACCPDLSRGELALEERGRVVAEAHLLRLDRGDAGPDAIALVLDPLQRRWRVRVRENLPDLPLASRGPVQDTGAHDVPALPAFPHA